MPSPYHRVSTERRLASILRLVGFDYHQAFTVAGRVCAFYLPFHATAFEIGGHDPVRDDELRRQGVVVYRMDAADIMKGMEAVRIVQAMIRATGR